mmetsp:Transcript_39109/g.110526  ORF Transcript_39109/g.110526 Transcript_39109/m.110526 type:complete len:206 (-) Transcript_39109:609-1226(-)
MGMTMVSFATFSTDLMYPSRLVAARSFSLKVFMRYQLSEISVASCTRTIHFLRFLSESTPNSYFSSARMKNSSARLMLEGSCTGLYIRKQWPQSVRQPFLPQMQPSSSTSTGPADSASVSSVKNCSCWRRRTPQTFRGGAPERRQCSHPFVKWVSALMSWRPSFSWSMCSVRGSWARTHFLLSVLSDNTASTFRHMKRSLLRMKE